MPKEENKFSVGDIIPIQQIVGFEVVKRVENGEPITISTDNAATAEILSAIFKLNSVEVN